MDSLRNALLDAFVGGFSSNGVKEEDNGITYLDNPGECVTDRDLKVVQVLESGNAIARGITSWFDGIALTSGGAEVLLLRKDGDLYYSGQIVKIPQGYCARRVGVYRQSSFSTCPVVRIGRK